MHGRDGEPTARSGSGEQRGTSFTNPQPRESDSGLNIYWYEMWLHSMSFVCCNKQELIYCCDVSIFYMGSLNVALHVTYSKFFLII